jgi:uncharacterized protein with ParB-like and HNH nuclease domain
MAKNIEPNLKLISDYLKLNQEENFVIPEYQRAYSWNIRQCDKLWQDIENYIETGASDPYFFGTIIVDCSALSGREFKLIDGQQRTTTFFLLLKALLLRLNVAITKIADDEEAEALKAGLNANRNLIMSILYKAEAEDIPAMLKDYTKIQNITILENKSINELYPDEIKHIIEARDFVTAEQNVKKIPRKQKDNKYTNYFRNFKFFYNKLGEKTETQLNLFAKTFLKKCQIIEIRSWQIEQAITMFNSLNSTGMPLSDADIISAQLYSNADNREEFNKQWEYINKLVNELNNQKIIDIDAVLQQFMYINRAINKEYIKVKEDGSFSIDVTTPGLRRYYLEIQKELLNEPLSLCDKFANIAETWLIIKDFSIVKLLLKFNENAKLFLVSYLSRFEVSEITNELVREITELLLRLFTILELSDLGYSSSKFKTFLFGENTKIVDKNIPIDEIKEDFNRHIKQNWNEEDLENYLIDYDKNVLVYLNEYLFSKNKGVSFDFTEKINIEHIMPASGKNITTIQQDAGIEDKEEFKAIVNKIGNKILLEENINKSISNEWFKSKKQNSINDKAGYKDSRFAIAKSLISYPKDIWTKEDIEIVTKKVAKRIIEFIFSKQNKDNE